MDCITSVSTIASWQQLRLKSSKVLRSSLQRLLFPIKSNDVVVERGGKVVFLSDTYEGKQHDKKIADEEDYKFLQQSTLWQDTGFRGYAPDGVTIKQPQKKPRNAELSDAQKEENQAISKVRVEVEHHIGGIKRCQIVVQKFRNRVDHYADDVMETACGLPNLKLTHRQKRPVIVRRQPN